MCGFLVSIGGKLHTKPKLGNYLRSRGEDSTSSVIKSLPNDREINFQFSHLFITKPNTKQPLSKKGAMLVINGEIYNSSVLCRSLTISDKDINDTSAFFEYTLKFGIERAVKDSSGMFSGVYWDGESEKLHFFTDHIGKKPLILSKRNGILSISSGLDDEMLSRDLEFLESLSPGLWQYDIVTEDLLQLVKGPQYYDHITSSTLSLKEAVIKAVLERVPKQIPFAVPLSGGLDSSIIASILENNGFNTHKYFVVGNELPSSVKSLTKFLNIKPERVIKVAIPNQEHTSSILKECMKLTKSYNPSIVSNGIATLLLAQAVNQESIRVVLSGEGADEFFCGYQGMYNGRSCAKAMREQLIRDLHFTELRRLDLVFAANSIEARCPFLDKSVAIQALSCNERDLCSAESNQGKTVLRQTFKKELPNDIIEQPKEPFDITSGIQQKVIESLEQHRGKERDALKAIFTELFGTYSWVEHPYFSHYPAFDSVIDNRKQKYMKTATL